MPFRSLLTAGLLILAALPTTAQVPFNTARLDSLLDGLASHHKLMGSLALAANGQSVYSHAFGTARLTPSVPATTTTTYRIGSVSKLFTAVLIFQLVEEKKLALETPLAKFFPELPNASRITIDQLLSHRSGLHNFTDDAAYTQYLTRPKTQAELVTIIGATKPDFEPGVKYGYSNANYMLLGYIIEKLTNQSYGQALQQRIAAKAGLTSTYYGQRSAAQPQEARSYERVAGSWQLSPETDMSIPGGAGALVATPMDLNRFLNALFAGRLIPAASLKLMQTVQDGYGRELLQLPFGTKIGYGHTGGIDAFRALSFYWPDDQLALSLCSNGGSYSSNEVVAAALRLYFHQPYHLPNLAPSTYLPVAAELNRCSGTYASPGFPLKIKLLPEGTTLRCQATGQKSFLLEPVGPGAFRFESAGIQIMFDAAKPSFTMQQSGRSLLFTQE